MRHPADRQFRHRGRAYRFGRPHVAGRDGGRTPSGKCVTLTAETERSSMEQVHDEISRIRRQVERELTHLPLAPWRPKPTRRRRAMLFARNSLGEAWRRSRLLVRSRA
jgi:hypothetical protein